VGFFNKCGDFTWRVSDCEELSGSYSQEVIIGGGGEGLSA